MTGLVIPRATYRLQLNSTFTFRDATALIPYLADLGISHVYCSPYFRARPGSTHGYDIVDHNAINPEIGSREDLETFVRTLRQHQMGHILDIVPNHVGIMGSDNAWWMDVLENGQDSPYADYFDIDWQSVDPALAGKVLVPILGAPYGEVLDSGELQLRHEPESDSYAVWYHEHRFPIARRDYDLAHAVLDAGNAAADTLHELLERQSYRLAFWRVAADDINYRRFFDVNDLAALRMEHGQVFARTHQLIFELLEQGQLDGLRVDHPDGLYDPAQYFSRLQDRLGSAGGQQMSLYVVAEKILAGGEKLPDNWRVHGTTGYRFTNVVHGMFVDSTARSRMDRIYRSFLGESVAWEETARESRLLILRTAMAAELGVLANQLVRIARADRRTRDFTLNKLRDALAEVIACFPVYRTYIAETVAEQDRVYISAAIQEARRSSAGHDAATFDFIEHVLVGEDTRTFARKFQQVTAPVMAKGVEDTALYRFHRLVSLNEVGGEPDVFGISVHRFHADSRYRARFWPHEMLTTSTHDTKRSEDVRARIGVLSEVPAEWRAMLLRWRRMNREYKHEIDGKLAPGPNQEYLLYQTLLGTLPVQSMDENARKVYSRRIGDYMIKASREAKTRTSWSDIGEQYESALQRFVERILDPGGDNPFPADLHSVVQRFSRFGLMNSLAQVLCKLTLPGVPDIYQGTELWDDSLVDPDNRRPVDYDSRRRMLAQVQNDVAQAADRSGWLLSLLDHIDDGRAKLFVTHQALQLRRSNPELFARGAYVPLRAAGRHAAHVCAFARRRQDRWAIVVVPRLSVRLLGSRHWPPLGENVWGDTSVALPRRKVRRSLTNVFDATRVAACEQHDDGDFVSVGALLSHFPLALLEG